MTGLQTGIIVTIGVVVINLLIFSFIPMVLKFFIKKMGMSFKRNFSLKDLSGSSGKSDQT